MSLLTANNLAQSFAFVDVFSGISVTVQPDARIGLIGRNGVGKTSLLRIFAGIEQPRAGDVYLARDKRLGYLPQEAMDAFASAQTSVYAEMLTVFESLHAIEARMRELEAKMVEDHSVMDEYGTLQELFEHRGGYDYEQRIRRTLEGLGFTEPGRKTRTGGAAWDTPVAHLSGGQKTRALLARLLLEAPDLLILDEPTNHLDIAAIEWLEQTLSEWPGAIITCSHDRLFLDKVTNRIWDMSPKVIDVYRGNYSAYLTQRDERFERTLKVFNAEKDRLSNEARLIKRDFDAIKAGYTSAQPTWAIGKLKRLTTDVVTIEKYGVDFLNDNEWAVIAARLNAGDGGVPTPFSPEDAVKRVERLSPPSRPPRINLRLEPKRRSGEIALRTTGAQIGYPGNPLFDSDDVELQWRDRVALIGPNGSGKTTFLKTALASRTLSDEPVDFGLHPELSLKPLAGQIELGSSVRVGYFAQAHDELDATGTIESEIRRHAEAIGKHFSEGEVRYFLAQFLYTDDELAKPVAGLSGGERARLAMAVLSLRGANFLVLDEPTNHLDIAAQEVLEDVLTGFEGTVLVVSHDRYLIRKIANQIWWIDDKRLRAFRGTYDEWLRRPADAAVKPKQSAAAKPAPVEKPRAASAPNPQMRAKQLAELETDISTLESRLAALTASIESAGKKGQGDKVRTLGAELAEAQRTLDQKLAAWEALSA
jgi:ATP-binding cassette, subfamily F, member 3